MKTSSLLLLIVCATIFSSSCKKDKAETNLFIEKGSVTGTIVGTKSDNSALNETFAFNKYMDYQEKQYYTYEASITANIFDIEYSTDNGSQWTLKFSLGTAAGSIPNLIDFNISFYKQEANAIFHFNMYNNANNTPTWSDCSFDATTGRLKGKLSLTGTTNSAEKSVTVVSNFDVVLLKLVE